MRESELSQFYLDQMLALLSTPLGVFGLLALITLIGTVVVFRDTRWVLVACVIYATTVPLTAGANVVYVPLAAPLDQIRTFGRPLIYLLLCLLLIPLISSERGWRRKLVPAAAVFFLLFQVLVAARLMVFGNVFRGGLSLISHLLIAVTLGYGIARSLQSMQDVYKLVWAFSCTGGLLLLATLYQLAVNRSLIINNGRLIGVTANPQYMGFMMATTLPFTAFLLTRPNGRKWVRPLLIAQVVLMVVMLLWTGSRNGALSTLVGMAVLFHRRLGRFLVAGTVVGVLVYLMLPYFEGSGEIATRLVWTTNTRTQVWQNMVNQFLSSPLLGVSDEMFNTQENSYLAMLSQFGLVGSIPCFIAVGLLVRQLLHLRRYRGRLGEDAGLIDLTCAAWAALGVTTVFEGLLLGVITYAPLYIFTLLSLTTCLQDWGEAEEAYAIEAADPYAAAA